MYARNRHSLEADTSGAWKDLNLSNRVSDAMPVYFGVNRALVNPRVSGWVDNIENRHRARWLCVQGRGEITVQR